MRPPVTIVLDGVGRADTSCLLIEFLQPDLLVQLKTERADDGTIGVRLFGPTRDLDSGAGSPRSSGRLR